MDGITLYDSTGQPLKKFYQWDVNQFITVKGLDPSLEYEFNFCHRGDPYAMISVPEVTDGDLKVWIPNIIFTSPDPLIMYVLLIEGEDSVKTVYTVRIPVEDRPQPHDYEAEDFTPDQLRRFKGERGSMWYTGLAIDVEGCKYTYTESEEDVIIPEDYEQ